MELTVDPFNLPQAGSVLWTHRRIQAWFIFGVCVAGKGAAQTAKKVEYLIENLDLLGYVQKDPFEALQFAFKEGGTKYVRFMLKEVRMGQYKRISKALKKLCKLDPYTVPLQDLQEAVGLKTARMLLLYTRPNFYGVPLDTHILKYLHSIGAPDVPKATPSSKKQYLRLESIFQNEALSQRKTVRELDTEVWKNYATKKTDEVHAA